MHSMHIQLLPFFWILYSSESITLPQTIQQAILYASFFLTASLLYTQLK